MALEEVLDGLVYTASAILRLSERRRKRKVEISNNKNN